MSKQYDDSRYGVENVVFLPAFTISANVIAPVLVASDNMEITEFGYVVTTLTSASAAATTIGVAIRDGATTIATVRVAGAGSAVGAINRTTTIDNGSSLNQYDTLTFVTQAAATGQAGVIAPYIKYRERY